MTSETLTKRETEYAVAALPTNSRPTLCTEDNTSVILDAIKDGLSMKDSARLAGVTETTLHNWQRFGRIAVTKQDNNEPLTYNDTLYLNFFQRLETAKIEKKRTALKNIAKAGLNEKHWHANAWWLERVHPAEFGKIDRMVVDDWRRNKDAQGIDAEQLLKMLSDSIADKLIERAEDASYREIEGGSDEP